MGGGRLTTLGRHGEGERGRGKGNLTCSLESLMISTLAPVFIHSIQLYLSVVSYIITPYPTVKS